MELLGVRVELPANTPVVMLREHDGDRGRVLPILIGGPEAAAIHAALEGLVPPRPLTHDLLVVVLQTLGATLDQVVITEVRDHTFYAELHLSASGQTHQVSSRPSDAIALAARTGSPIFAAEAVLDEAAYAVSEEDEEEEQEVVEQFKEFIDNVNPEDFAS